MASTDNANANFAIKEPLQNVRTAVNDVRLHIDCLRKREGAAGVSSTGERTLNRAQIDGNYWALALKVRQDDKKT